MGVCFFFASGKKYRDVCGVLLAYPVGLENGTLLETNIAPEKSILKMIFLFPRAGYVRYVSSLEGSVSNVCMLFDNCFT